MHDIMRERVWRRLQALPQDQLYQVLDYIEFLEAKYAKEEAVRADPIQKFAERLEDGLRMRAVAPKVISGTVGLLGTARKVVRTVSDAGRELFEEATTAVTRPAEPRPQEPAALPPGQPNGSPGGTPQNPPREESGSGS